MNLAWYWHRLRAMSPGEVALRGRKQWRELVDRTFQKDWSSVHFESAAEPLLPPAHACPPALKAALKADAEQIRTGHWLAFGHLPLRVDDPPRWHKDYLANVDLPTSASAFRLDTRSLPAGADVKLIWELSRWHELVRLAMAAYVLDDFQSAEKCVLWLEDWVKQNPPFRGWNWTNALEAGLRLIQFTWLDALLSAKAEAWNLDAELDTIRYQILPAHAWYTWRHRSFGSSANNHLLGELAGLIVACARWPALRHWCVPLPELQQQWEAEVLAQFHADGGNKEEALHYHFFSLELCLYARDALARAGQKIAPQVDERLSDAIEFFCRQSFSPESWPYGDSDDAFVLPLASSRNRTVEEWRAWLAGKPSPALDYWLGDASTAGRAKPAPIPVSSGWHDVTTSGYRLFHSPRLSLRWDGSALGYLSTAAHGHLDSLHLSVWVGDTALVIDPGTGAYYGDAPLRRWLASRAAHNGPRPLDIHWPKRVGLFLWEQKHRPAEFREKNGSVVGRISIGDVTAERRIIADASGGRVEVSDAVLNQNGSGHPFAVRWQFAPGTQITGKGERQFLLTRAGHALIMQVSDAWSCVSVASTPAEAANVAAESDLEHQFSGTVSPAFRKTEFAPFVKLLARPKAGQPCLFRTAFVPSGPS